jgi:hypothetical protein
MKPIILMLGLAVQSGVLAQESPTPRPSPTAQARFESLVAQIQEFQRRYTTHRRGSDHPEAFRYGSMLTSMLAYGGPADDVGFAQFVLERYGATGADVEVLKEARDASAAARAGGAAYDPDADHCTRLLDGSLRDAIDVARYIIELDERPEREAADRNRSFLAELSPPVRATVLQRIDEQTANVVSSNLDHLAMAIVDPDLYVTMVTGYCRGKQHALARPRPEHRAPASGNGISVDQMR